MYLTTSNYTDAVVGYVTSANYNPFQSAEYAAQLDGLTKFWQLSDPIAIPANTDFKLTFTLSGVGNNREGIMEGTGMFLRFLTENDTIFFDKNVQMSIANVSFALLTLANGYTRDGSEKKISIFRQGGDIYSKINNEDFRLDSSNKVGAFSISNLGKHVSDHFSGFLYSFEVEIDGVVTNQIQLTNKAQGATQLATVGSVNATMIGYTGNEWIDRSTL